MAKESWEIGSYNLRRRLRKLKKTKGLELPALESKSHPWWGVWLALVVVAIVALGWAWLEGVR